MQFIPVASFDNYIEANIILGRLENENINCWLKDENTVTVNPLLSQAIGGIKLMVAEQHVQRASDLLQEITVDKKAKAKCPKCGSDNVQYISSSKTTNRLTALLSFIFTNYAVQAEKAYHCFRCGNEFSTLPADDQ